MFDRAFDSVFSMFGMRRFSMFEVGDSTNPGSEPFSDSYPRVFISTWIGSGEIDRGSST